MKSVYNAAFMSKIPKLCGLFSACDGFSFFECNILLTTANGRPGGQPFFLLAEQLAAAVVVATAVVVVVKTAATAAAAAHEDEDQNKNPGAVSAKRAVTHSNDLLFLLYSILCRRKFCVTNSKFF